jgi:LysR family transcriptional regulator, regulator for bpeEF and oprC
VSGWINDYLQRYPKVNIEADFSGRIFNIIDEGYHLAIRIGELKDSGLIARRLGMLQYGLFASPDYLNSRGMPKAPEDLAQHELLIFDQASHHSRWHLIGADEENHIVEGSVRLKVNNSFAARDAALLGIGVSQLPWIIAKEQVRLGLLTKILPEWSIPEVPVNALYPSQKYLTPKVRAFIDFAVNAFEQQANQLG